MSDSQRQKERVHAELSEILLEDTIRSMESCLRQAFKQRRDVFLSEILKRLRQSGVGGGAPGRATEVEGGWVDVESLSKLRNLVGGRFENIKKKWVGAGFPLREHRGDKSGGFELSQSGWVELSNWMSKHGFEARLCPDKPECVFQIRQLGNSK